MTPSTVQPLWSVRRRLLTVAILALAVVPPILLAQTIDRLGVDLPFWDEWALGRDLVAWLDGTFEWRMLWRQHNDHRVPVPRLVLLGLARVSGWDARWELWLNVVIVAGALMCLAAALRRILPAQPVVWAMCVLVASLLLFSPAASENWRWGWQASVFLALLAVAALTLSFATWRGRWWQVGLAVTLTVMAVGSFASGLVLIGLVPAVIALHPDGGTPRRRLVQAAAALAAGGLLVALYFWDFEHPSHHPEAQSDVALLTYYTLVYLGAPWATTSVNAAWHWGAGGLMALGLLGGVLAGSGPAARRALPPLLFLCAFSLLNGAITGIGRAGFGVGQALATRYVTFGVLFWIGLAPMLGLVVARVAGDGRATRSLCVGIGLGVLLATAAGAYRASWDDGVQRMAEHGAKLRWLLGGVRWPDPAPNACVGGLFADVAGVRDTIARLAARGYGPRRRLPARPALTTLGRPVPDGARGAVDSVEVKSDPRPVVQLTGWAVDAARTLRAAGVVAVADGVVVGRSGTWNRAPHGGRATPDQGRWRITIPTYRLGTGTARIEVWAVLRDGRGVAPLPGGPWIVELPRGFRS